MPRSEKQELLVVTRSVVLVLLCIQQEGFQYDNGYFLAWSKVVAYSGIWRDEIIEKRGIRVVLCIQEVFVPSLRIIYIQIITLSKFYAGTLRRLSIDQVKYMSRRCVGDRRSKPVRYSWIKVG